MAIRSGAEYRESLQDGRTVFVAGERLADVTAYPPFSGVIHSLCGLYDLQHERPDDLTYSDEHGEHCALSFLPAKSADDVIRRQRADELRAETTFGLMGRMPDFMNAVVTDVALGMRDHPTLDPAYIENLQRYQRDCCANDWCLTHTLVDPQVDRSRGPAEQADPELVLHRVRETDAGIVVRGARMLSTLAPFANELWVGPFYPRRPGEEDYALCFAMPMGTPGLRFLCREPYDLGRGLFDRPLSSRFDEEDALAIFDDVLVPWERVFVAGDLTAYNDLVPSVPGLTFLQAATRGLVKLRFLIGLVARLAEAIGRDSDPHHQLRLGEVAAQVEVLAGALRGSLEEVVDRLRDGTPLRALPALLFVAIPDLQIRAIDVIRRVAGSGLVMTPTEADLDHAEIGPVVERFLQGRAVGGRNRVRLFKLAWDMVGEPCGSRQMLYEWFYAGDPQVNRIRFGSTPEVERYKQMVEPLLI